MHWTWLQDVRTLVGHIWRAVLLAEHNRGIVLPHHGMCTPVCCLYSLRGVFGGGKMQLNHVFVLSPNWKSVKTGLNGVFLCILAVIWLDLNVFHTCHGGMNRCRYNNRNTSQLHYSIILDDTRMEILQAVLSEHVICTCWASKLPLHIICRVTKAGWAWPTENIPSTLWGLRTHWRECLPACIFPKLPHHQIIPARCLLMLWNITRLYQDAPSQILNLYIRHAFSLITF